MSENSVDYKLVVLKGGIRGTEFALKQGSNFVGRWDPESGSFPEINLENEDIDAKVSRKHALLEVSGENQVTIEDLGSLNGTFINRGSKLNTGVKCRLHLDDEIVIGKVFLKLEKA